MHLKNTLWRKHQNGKGQGHKSLSKRRKPRTPVPSPAQKIATMIEARRERFR